MKSSKIKKIIFYLFFVGILYFFGKTLYVNFAKIGEYDFSINFVWLLPSLFVFLAFFYSLGILWKHLLFRNLNDAQKQGITTKNIHYINAISWISKYLPGKVAMIATKVLYLENKGVPKKTSFLSCLYEHIFQIIASFFLSLPFIIYYFFYSEKSHYVYLSLFLLVALFVSTLPQVFHKIITLALQVVKKDPPAQSEFLSLKEMYSSITGYSLSMILKGLSFVLFVLSITSISNIQEVFFLVFAWIFAGVIGIISLFSPNGLGVREGVLTVILSLVFPIEIAILLSIGSRLWFSICDGVIGLGIVLIRFKSKKYL